MLRIAFAVAALALAVTADAAQMYRIDLKVEEKGKPTDTPLTLLEAGKDASIEIADADGTGRRYELRLDGGEDAQGRTSGVVHLRVVDIRKHREHERGVGTVAIERLGVPLRWQPEKRVKDLAIDVTVYRQPF